MAFTVHTISKAGLFWSCMLSKGGRQAMCKKAGCGNRGHIRGARPHCMDHSHMHTDKWFSVHQVIVHDASNEWLPLTPYHHHIQPCLLWVPLDYTPPLSNIHLAAPVFHLSPPNTCTTCFSNIHILYQANHIEEIGVLVRANPRCGLTKCLPSLEKWDL